MYSIEHLPSYGADPDTILTILFSHLQFAGILCAVNMLIEGLSTWKGGAAWMPGKKARNELLIGIWILRVFLFPAG